MAPEDRTKNLMKLLGWQGGTIHDACNEIGVDVHAFLYTPAEFDYFGIDCEYGPCPQFRLGYSHANDIAIYTHEHRGDVQYWLGAVCAVNSDHENQNELEGK